MHITWPYGRRISSPFTLLFYRWLFVKFGRLLVFFYCFWLSFGIFAPLYIVTLLSGKMEFVRFFDVLLQQMYRLFSLQIKWTIIVMETYVSSVYTQFIHTIHWKNKYRFLKETVNLTFKDKQFDIQGNEYIFYNVTLNRNCKSANVNCKALFIAHFIVIR